MIEGMSVVVNVMLSLISVMSPPPALCNLSLRTVVKLCTVYFDSCITTTLTLFLSSTSPSSVSLFPIPLALSCRTLNVLSSLICSVGGAGDRVGGGDCWDDGAEQVSQVQKKFLRYWAAFKIPEHFACTNPEYLVHL